MKYCTRCGKQLADGALTCPYCGENACFNGGYGYGQPQFRQNAVPPVADSCSALSIIGLVFAFLFVLVGLTVSIIAYNEAKRTGSASSLSLSKAGIIVSSVQMGIGLLAALIWVFVFLLLICGFRGYCGC